MVSRKIILRVLLAFLIITYLGVHIGTLTAFPYIHSDEAWLSGFSRTVLDKGTFQTVEPFFDLYPRAIHGLRLVFVSVQMLMIKAFGYSITTMRSLSLMLSLVSLIVVYRLLKKMGAGQFESILMTGCIAFMSQFVMMSHVARQEPFILLGMLGAYYMIVHSEKPLKHLIIPATIGLCIGVHPNSFIIGVSIGLLYLYQWLRGTIHFKHVLSYIGQLSLWASLFVGASFKLNPNFLQDYLAFGDQLGVVHHSLNRFEGFYYYYYKLWQQIGGTYVLVPIRIDLMVLATGLIISLFVLISKRMNGTDTLYQNVLMVIGINLGLLMIGRYNQTAIVFVLIFGWLLCFNGLLVLREWLNPKPMLLLILCLLSVLQLTSLHKTISTSRHESYEEFGANISQHIPEDSRVLANLNLDYHLNLYQLYDIRNLNYLNKHQMTFRDYIEKNQIEYIVLYEEMTYIHEAGGKWDILYGSLPYYDDMMTYLDGHCSEIYSFEAPTYGMRIAKYVDVYPWGVTIYQVDKFHSSSR